MDHSKYITRDGTLTTGAGVAGTIDAATEVLTVDTADLMNMSVFLVQIVDAGTVVIVIEGSPDGNVWEVIDASTAETDFPAGNNAVVKFTLSDSNGMSLAYKQIRARCTALAGGGSYGLKVAGRQQVGYK